MICGVLALALFGMAVTTLAWDYFNGPEKQFSIELPAVQDFPESQSQEYLIRVVNRSANKIRVVGLTWC